MKKDYPVSFDKSSKRPRQRALVLQGGGGLGAYQVGVLKVLCKRLVQSKGSSNEEKDRPLFDIIAASSIGAMNAAVLVSNVVNRKKTWKDAVKELENFWMDEKNGLSSTPDISKWLDDAKKQKNFSASPEAARRYYSVKYYLLYGTPNVCSPERESDLKFADRDNNNNPLQWPWYTSNPLQHAIERYSKDEKDEKAEKLRIATSWDKRQPRLLVISVDVAGGKTVAFDSYYKKARPKNPVYDGDGITIDHIMASGTIPAFYKFREIGGRKFCDGGWLNNTPFRELLQAHRDYWVKAAGEDTDEIPDLDVYIVNVHPSKADSIPTDYDEVKNRANDISFSDRNSHYDEMVTHLAADYNELVNIKDFTELINKLKDLAKTHFKRTDKNDKFQKDFQHLLKTTEAKTKTWSGSSQKYKDIIKGKFKLANVIRIERTDYINSNTGKDFSTKPTDFTYQTIKKLIEQGEQDASEVLK
jgi:predicted acylesterase/phospholipase RssA